MNQQTIAMLRLREMVLHGELAAGERVPEAAVAKRLGLSRTPVRQALPALAQEGLLVAAGRRGYAVRRFAPQESLDALELRAALEGLAARAIAERGASPELLAELDACLAEGDAIFREAGLQEQDELRYGAMNERFHDLIVMAAEKPLLADLAARCKRVPFVAPLTIAFDRSTLPEMYDLLLYAHRQHHAIVDAIRARDGARAEALFREHAFTQKKSMKLGAATPQG
jgi:GntR family transcriptional regulator of vanillate catabolism